MNQIFLTRTEQIHRELPFFSLVSTLYHMTSPMEYIREIRSTTKKHFGLSRISTASDSVTSPIYRTPSRPCEISYEAMGR